MLPNVEMSEPLRRRVLLELPWPTLLKILLAVAAVWCLIQLIDIILLLIVAVILTVTLDPIVNWLEHRGLSRTASVTIISVATLTLVGGFVWLTWASLVEQTGYLTTHADEFQKQITPYLPRWLRNSADSNSAEVSSRLGNYFLGLAQSATTAGAYVVVGFFLTIYLLLEGRRTRDWLIAFVPLEHRNKVDRTLDESRQVLHAYVAGNVLTSVIATVTTLVALSLLKVPAALVLALMAGLSDFVPVVGFIVSAIPAVGLALTVSGQTAAIVVAVYILYNLVESYLIFPWAYGSTMKLSNVAVILAFLVGAQLAGVIGALIALPIAAIYPTIERVWLRGSLPEETVQEHRALEAGKAV